MQSARIYHISEGRALPLTQSERGPFALEVIEQNYRELSTIEPAGGSTQIFILQMEPDRLNDMVDVVKQCRSLDDYPKIIIVSESEFERARRLISLIPRAALIGDSIRPAHLRLIIDLIVQQEYYRQVVYRMSHDARARGEIFENLMELARNELRRTRDENQAYQSLVDYESEIRKSEKQIQEALEMTMQLKNQELVTLKSQLEAIEKLSEYRDQELIHARSTLKATEAALDLSTRENIQRESLITAMDRLRIYTDKELMDLYNENQALRQKLGMPPRE